MHFIAVNWRNISSAFKEPYEKSLVGIISFSNPPPVLNFGALLVKKQRFDAIDDCCYTYCVFIAGSSLGRSWLYCIIELGNKVCAKVHDIMLLLCLNLFVYVCVCLLVFRIVLQQLTLHAMY